MVGTARGSGGGGRDGTCGAGTSRARLFPSKAMDSSVGTSSARAVNSVTGPSKSTSLSSTPVSSSIHSSA